MAKSKPYASIPVKDVQLAELLEQTQGQSLWAGIDVSKEHLLVVLSGGPRCFSRPWKVRYPEQLNLLVQMLRELADTHRLVVAIEPTGAYSDPLRWALTQAGLTLHRIDSKASHDYAEIFDGTPSQHDGKDAAILAELARHDRGTPWPLHLKADDEAAMRSLVDQIDDYYRVAIVWMGRLESLLARHWPEITQLLPLNKATLPQLLAEYGSPAALAQDPQAASKLRAWSARMLSEKKIQAVLDSARTTCGVPVGLSEKGRIQSYAAEAIAAHQQVEKIKKALSRLVEKNPAVQRIADALGKATACVLWTMLGDPRQYPCAGAYLKAAGLNLKERSSGKYQGQLKISKRGPAIVRRWLYLAAVRLVASQEARQWLGAKRERDESRASRHRGAARKGVGLVGMVALMRRLLAAVWHITRKRQPFDRGRLFAQPVAAWCH